MTLTKTILITGASSGFGKATAQSFLGLGWNVVATMRKTNHGLFTGDTERLLVLPLEVTDSESIANTFSEAIRRFGRINVVVNNAGIGLLSAFEVTPERIVREIFETNTFGVMNVCRAAIPHLRVQGGGTIINVTSSAGIAPMPLVAIYTASKSAIEGFTESLSYEMELVGIKMRLVEPGLAPSTNFAANGGERMKGLILPPYSDFAQSYFQRIENYPTPYSTEQDIVDAVFAAVTNDGNQLRFPAGPDTKLLSELRWSTSEQNYLAEMRRMFGSSLHSEVPRSRPQ